MNDATVRQVVRSKIADGRLPRDRIGKVSASTGLTNYATHALRQSRLKQYCNKLVRAGSDGFVFHATCFTIWRDERNSMTSVRAALRAGAFGDGSLAG